MSIPTGVSDGGTVYLSDISPDDSLWDSKRSKTDELAKMYSEGDSSRLSNRVAFCSKFLDFAVVDTDGKSSLKLYSAMFCHARLCPVCSWRKSRMWIHRFKKILPNLLSDYPAARYILLTLTVKNCHIDDLKTTIQHMNKSFDRLAKTKRFPAIGYIRSLEVTREWDKKTNKFTDYAHPHFHVLLMVTSTYFGGNYYIKQSEWVKMWQKAARLDYEPSVHTVAIKSKPDNLEEKQHPIYKSLCETLKYTVKESDLFGDVEWLIKLTTQLHKVRSISVGGVFKQYLNQEELDNPSDNDLVHPDKLAKEDLRDNPHILASWRSERKRYQLAQTGTHTKKLSEAKTLAGRSEFLS